MSGPQQHGGAPPVLALDLGSSSVRALVLHGDQVPPGGLARRPVHMAHDGAGGAVFDAEDYLAALADCLDELAGRGALDGVTLVATATQWHSVAGLGADGRPLTPVVTWADTRAVPGPGPADPVAYHRRTGAWHHGLYWSARLPWLRDGQQVAAAGWAGLPEIVGRRLLGDGAASVSSASGTGLLDVGRMCWDEEACALAGVRPGQLPELAAEGWQGRLTADHARRWPALAGVPWAPFTGDGAAANIGAGCPDPATVSATIGTSAAVRVVQLLPAGEAPPLPGTLWRYRVDHHRVVTGRAFSAGGNLFGWARQTLDLPAGDLLAAELDALVPGSHGLTALPFLAGSRPPESIVAGAGAISGLGLATRPVHLLAALLEGVALEMRQGLATIAEMLGAAPEVVLTGGAVEASPWWQRTLAAAVGHPVLLSAQHETAARGAALIALGRRPQPAFRRVTPDPAAVAQMSAAGDRYRALRAAVLPCPAAGVPAGR